MKTVLIIYCAISLFCFLMTFIVAKSAKNVLNRRYAYYELKQISTWEKIFGFIRVIFFCCLPLFHLIWCFVMMVKGDDFVNDVANTLEESIILAVENDDKS